MNEPLYQHRQFNPAVYLNYSAISSIVYIIVSYSFTLTILFAKESIHVDIGFWKFCAIAGHLFLFMSIWSYAKVIMIDPGQMPPNYTYPQDYQGRRRYCLLCRRFKPQRTHHCSHCSRCVLKMNIHLKFYGCCIGFFNQKYYYLSLFYLILMELTFTAYDTYYLIAEISYGFQDQAYVYQVLQIIHIIVITTQIVIALILIGILTFNIYLLLMNYTSIEYWMDNILNRQMISKYDVGKYENFKQVFGKNPLIWLLPITIKNYLVVDGIQWPKNQRQQHANRQILAI